MKSLISLTRNKIFSMLSMIVTFSKTWRVTWSCFISSKSVAKQVRLMKHLLGQKLRVIATIVFFHVMKGTWLQTIVCLSPYISIGVQKTHIRTQKPSSVLPTSTQAHTTPPPRSYMSHFWFNTAPGKKPFHICQDLFQATVWFVFAALTAKL